MGGRGGAPVSPELRCAECALVDRRTFLAQTALAGVAAFLAGCSAGSGPTGPSFNGPLVVSPAQYPSLNAVGGIARVDTPDGYPIAVVHMGAQQYAAFSLVCPHQRTALRWNQGDGQFQCPKHHSKYRPDGTFVSGRATRGMDRFSVTRSGDEIVVDLDAMHKEDKDPAGWAAAVVHL